MSKFLEGDLYEGDSVQDIVRTEGFELIVRGLENMARHYEQIVVNAASDMPVDQIRLAAGRVNGIRLVIDRLKKIKKVPHG